MQRHDIFRLLIETENATKNGFKAYPIGYFHIDIAELGAEQGKLRMVVAIDRTSRFAFVELHERVSRQTAAYFLQRLIAAVPYKVHIVLTDNGTHFTTPSNKCSAAADLRIILANGERFRAHAFALACAKAEIDHWLTKPAHPWTNGRAERMNRTLKDATVRATTTRHTNSSRSTWPSSSAPTQFRQAPQKALAASCPSRPSAKQGRTNPSASGYRQTTSHRD